MIDSYNVQVKQRKSTGSSELSLVTYTISIEILCADPYKEGNQMLGYYVTVCMPGCKPNHGL